MLRLSCNNCRAPFRPFLKISHQIQTRIVWLEGSALSIRPLLMPKSKYITGIVYGFKLCESFSFTNLGNKLLVKVVKARLVVGVDRRSDGDEEDDVVLSKPLPLRKWPVRRLRSKVWVSWRCLRCRLWFRKLTPVGRVWSCEGDNWIETKLSQKNSLRDF